MKFPPLLVNMNQQTDRLRALWKSGRDKYRSFFTVLNEVRAEIGNDALPAYCRDELSIGLTVITSMTSVLGKMDETAVKADLVAANTAKNEQRAAEINNAKQVKLVATRQRERDAEVHRKTMIDEKLETFKAEVELKKVQTRERERLHRLNDPEQVGTKSTAKRNKRAITTKLPDADLLALAERFRQAETLCDKSVALDEKSKAFWIQGSMAKAAILCEARARFAADQEFGKWVADNALNIPRDDRQALINLGRLGVQSLQEILTNTETRSYRSIWQNQSRLRGVA